MIPPSPYTCAPTEDIHNVPQLGEFTVQLESFRKFPTNNEVVFILSTNYGTETFTPPFFFLQPCLMWRFFLYQPPSCKHYTYLITLKYTVGAPDRYLHFAFPPRGLWLEVAGSG